MDIEMYICGLDRILIFKLKFKYKKFDVWNTKFTTIIVPCADTDTTVVGNETIFRYDSRGDVGFGDSSCADGTYPTNMTCGKYDDDDFKSNLMCCDCGGGTTGKWKLNAYWNSSDEMYNKHQ